MRMGWEPIRILAGVYIVSICCNDEAACDMIRVWLRVRLKVVHPTPEAART